MTVNRGSEGSVKLPKAIPAVLVSSTALTKYRGLKQQKFIVLQFKRLELQNQGISTVGWFFLRSARDETVPDRAPWLVDGHFLRVSSYYSLCACPSAQFPL